MKHELPAPSKLFQMYQTDKSVINTYDAIAADINQKRSRERTFINFKTK